MDFEALVMAIWLLIGLYAGAGLLAAIALHLGGLRRVDPDTEGAGLIFRILITPGILALWPLLLGRWRKAALGIPVFGAADLPRLPVELRTLHRRVVLGATIVVPILAAVALVARPAAPVAVQISGEVLPEIRAFPDLVDSWDRPMPDLPISASLRSDGSGRRQLELESHDELGTPDVVVYWLADGGDGPLSEGVYLGTVWGPATRYFDLPSGPGAIALYSLSHRETVGRFEIGEN